ncbi:TadE family protein [Rugosimonospora africana]|uniref:TadE family protein n=1 Tax=Rugosimonospora africana TaxID=556532 RepID=UPI0035715A15
MMQTSVWLLSLLLGVQVAVWGLAELACYYAANHALQTTRVQGGTADAGRTDAITVIGWLDGSLLTGVQVQADRGAATATVTVSGTAATVVPFLALPVGVTATGPVETLNP